MSATRHAERPSPANDDAAKGTCVLLVEDEAIISLMLEDALNEGGYACVSASRVEDALELARDNALGAAVLDVNLHGELIYSVADVLKQRGVPFLFVTGYAEVDIAPGFADRPILQKPFDAEQVLDAVSLLLNTPARGDWRRTSS